MQKRGESPFRRGQSARVLCDDHEYHDTVIARVSGDGMWAGVHWQGKVVRVPTCNLKRPPGRPRGSGTQNLASKRARTPRASLRQRAVSGADQAAELDQRRLIERIDRLEFESAKNAAHADSLVLQLKRIEERVEDIGQQLEGVKLALCRVQAGYPPSRPDR